MSESMIERVARALYERTHGAFIPDCAAPNEPPRFVPASWDGADVRDRDHHLANARAVLAAMRDLPDQLGNHLPTGYRPGSHSARAIWESIIDSALSEREKGNG